MHTNSLLSQPPGATTKVSELAVLTITSTHCGGVPTRIEMADQVPSSPYQFVEGVRLKAAVVLLATHRSKESAVTTEALFHLNTENMIEGSVAFYGARRTGVIEGSRKSAPESVGDGNVKG